MQGEELQCVAQTETLRTLNPKAEAMVPEYRQMLEI
jgi:hypothetical protein